mmetsp:Transcript_22779/g.28184  ORF Transcript_22779/g.28184 Transcript_22779/m.28184 type:complete len:163 (-) Transcript_22779:255-743(-)
MHKDSVDYTRWTRLASGSSVLINYYYDTLTRSLWDITKTANSLTPAETSSLSGNRWFYTLSNGKLIANQQTTDDKYWDLDVAKSSYDTATPGQTIVLSRKNAGVEEIKIDGASYVWSRFKDSAGVVTSGAYYKWAEEEHNSDGAASMATFAAVATAAIAALF